MRDKFILYFLVVITITESGCYYDKEDLLYPSSNANCDTITTVSYAQHISPLLVNKCAGCHTSGNPSGGIAMGTYSLDRVIASNGKLLGSIEHKPGYIPMPQGSAKLTTCEVATIKRWINNGMVNN